MGGNVLQRLISFFTIILITRYLGPERYGQFVVVLAFVSIVAVFWDFGLNTLLTRDVSRNKALTASYSGGTIAIKTALMILVIALSLPCLVLLGYSSVLIKGVLIFALVRYLISISEIFNSVFSAYRKMEFTALLEVLRSITLLILVLFVTHKAGGILDIFVCYLISTLVVVVNSVLLIKRNFSLPTFDFTLSLPKDLIKRGYPFFLISLVHIVLFKIDHLMLAKMVGNVQAGLYGSAYTIFEVVLSLFPLLMMTSAFPVLSELYQNNLAEMKRLFTVLLNCFLFLSIPLSCGALLLGKEIIYVVYGNDYLEAGILMSILGFSFWIFFLANLLAWTLTAVDKQKLVLIANVIAAIVNILLNLFLIPIFQSRGAAFSTMLCELFQLVFFGALFWKTFDMRANMRFAKIIIGSIVMCSVILLLKVHTTLPSNIVHLVLLILAGSSSYFAVAILLKTINTKEVRLLFKY